MNFISSPLISLLALALSAGGAVAQTTDHASHPNHAAKPAAGEASVNLWSEGLVRRIDLEAKKITLKHGPIATLGMDAMSMVFQMRDPAVLQAAQALKPGDAVQFLAAYDKGAYLVTGIRVAAAGAAAR